MTLNEFNSFRNVKIKNKSHEKIVRIFYPFLFSVCGDIHALPSLIGELLDIDLSPSIAQTGCFNYIFDNNMAPYENVDLYIKLDNGIKIYIYGTARNVKKRKLSNNEYAIFIYSDSLKGDIIRKSNQVFVGKQQCNKCGKLLIIDGSNLLFQMFFGMPSRIVNKDGKAIQGTLGFVGAFLKIIRMTDPTHIVVPFDGEHENDRAELNADYKANRIDYSTVAEEDSPSSQMNDVYKALDYMGIKHCECETLEADDVIARYALTLNNDINIIISSFDSDFFQLIGENVGVLRYRGDKTMICDTQYIQDRYSILPCQYADFKSLTGDNADNIKGADKVGPKTAAALINQFGNLEKIINNAEKIEKPSIRESIVRNSDRLQNNYKLIKLDDKAALPFSLKECIYSYQGITTNEVLRGVGLR